MKQILTGSLSSTNGILPMTEPVPLREGMALLGDLLADGPERAAGRIRHGDAAGFAAFLEHHHLAAWAVSVLGRERLRASFPEDVAAGLQRDVERRWRVQEAAVAALPEIAEALRNKFRVAKLYECTPVGAVSWWLLSLPFRLAVYRAGPRVLRRRLQHLFTVR